MAEKKVSSKTSGVDLSAFSDATQEYLKTLSAKEQEKSIALAPTGEECARLNVAHVDIERMEINPETGEKTSHPQRQTFNTSIAWVNFLKYTGLGFKVMKIYHLPEGWPQPTKEQLVHLNHVKVTQTIPNWKFD